MRKLTTPGRAQRAVLYSLIGDQQKSAQDITADWTNVSLNSVYSAINSLHRRGLVDLMGWRGDTRVWRLSKSGETMAQGRKFCVTFGYPSSRAPFAGPRDWLEVWALSIGEALQVVRDAGSIPCVYTEQQWARRTVVFPGRRVGVLRACELGVLDV